MSGPIELDIAATPRLRSSLGADRHGRLVEIGGRLLRGILTPERAETCRRLLASPLADRLFEAGLVRTWVPEDVRRTDGGLLLEHERLPFATHPAEATAQMHWESARTVVGLARLLVAGRLGLGDAHPWNLMLRRGRPVWIDFTSIGPPPGNLRWWLREFRRYFAVPIRLAATSHRDLAREYRRECENGFGLLVFEKLPEARAALADFDRLDALTGEPERLFDAILDWLERHRPARPPEGTWETYDQADGAPDPLTPRTEKHRALLAWLRRLAPRTVLDCAANKGYFAELAARLGSSVVAFDVDEALVDGCRDSALAGDLDVAPVLMDFTLPTPPCDLAQRFPGAFERLRCDVVLALGLVHHLCLRGGFPLELFFETCGRLAGRALILEFVAADDPHVAGWGVTAPADYDVAAVRALGKKWFPGPVEEAPWEEGGLRRRMMLFTRAAASAAPPAP